jgi:hypothetical protein
VRIDLVIAGKWRTIYAKEGMAMTPNLIRRSILAALAGSVLVSLATTKSSFVNPVSAGSTACPFTAKCPIDDAESNYKYSEFSGITEVGVYEHALTTGGVHRFRVKCN